MRTALVHEWLVSMGGGEKALQAIAEMYPGDLFTLIHNPEKLRGTFFEEKKIHTSFLQKIPFAKKKYQSLLPFFPMAVEAFDVSSYDLIISSSHCAAKGVLTSVDQLHLCYCYTPVRYAWDLYHQYLQETKLNKGMKGIFAKMILHYLRMWDKSSSSRVDAFAAISHYVAKRIRKIYGRESKVVYPGVDTSYFDLQEKKDNYYLTASRMVPYKKMDLIVEAFSHLPNEKLVVVGDGPERKKITSLAGKNVEILGAVSDDVLRELIRNAKAFIFAAIEDFGIVPVEAQAAGTPVIALGRGGSLETVSPDQGVFFQEQTIPSLLSAIDECKKRSFDPYSLRKHAQKFSMENFRRGFQEFVEENVKAHKKCLHGKNFSQK